MLGLFTTKAPVAVFATLTILDLKFLKIIIFVIVKKLMNLPCMRRVKQRKDWFFKESHTKTGVLKCVLGGICFGSIVPFIGFLLSLLTTMPEYLADTVEIGSFVFDCDSNFFFVFFYTQLWMKCVFKGVLDLLVAPHTRFINSCSYRLSIDCIFVNKNC
jgi:hypothetical protein